MAFDIVWLFFTVGSVSYTVFARKYRPRTFADVLGQDHVVRTLSNAIAKDRLAQAYLFVGPRGTGKTSTARILAKALNCTGGPKVDFDPDDDICQEIAEGRSLDVTEIDGASNNSVDDIRALREGVGFAPARGKYRIYYIDEVHMLSTAAFNALLRTLEEPPPHVKFIFATTEVQKILPTILSRCQRFDLRRIPANVIADHLLHIAREERLKLDRLAAHAIARGADGGMRDAQSMLDQLVAFCGTEISEADVLHIFGFTSHETVAKLSDDILRGKTAGALTELHAQSEAGKDLATLLADLILHFRNILIYQVDPAVALHELPPEFAGLMAEQSRLVNSERLMNLLDQFAEVDSAMRWAPNKRLCFEIGIIKAVQVLGEAGLSDVILALNGALGNAPPQAVAAAAGLSPSAGVPDAGQAGSPPAPASHPKTTGNLSGEALWAATLQEIERRMPLTSSWAAQGIYCETKGSRLVVGFHPDDSIACESLMRPATRTEIESILRSLGGTAWEFSPEVRKEITPPQATEPEPEAPLAAPPPEPPAPKAKELTPEEKQATADEAFRNDPMVLHIAEMFEAKQIARDKQAGN